MSVKQFKALYGSTTDDKNVVIKDLQWEFTGNSTSDRVPAYSSNINVLNRKS